MVRADVASWGCPDCGERIFADFDELAKLAKRHYAVDHALTQAYHFPKRSARNAMRICEPG